MAGTPARYSLTQGIPATRIGWLVAEARSVAGYTPDDLATRAGVRKRTVKRWEKGAQIPNDDEILAIARACEIGVGKLLPPRDTVEFDRDSRSLRVGSAVVSVADVHNEAVLTTYVQLVRQQRGLGDGAAFEIRHEDVDALAGTLDLDDDELEARLVSIVGMPAESAAGLRERMLHRRSLGIQAGIVAGSLGLLPGVGAGEAHASPSASALPAVVQPADRFEARVAEAEPAPVADAAPAPAPASKPAAKRTPPPTAPAIEIGDAVRIENPDAD
jgi:DNA-binding XRE family transcriptional regulator